VRHLLDHKKRQDAERLTLGDTWREHGLVFASTIGTFLLAQGVPARAIMEVLGHAEIGVTMNTYAHVLPVLRQEAADAIDELFGA
jgi:integrase